MVTKVCLRPVWNTIQQQAFSTSCFQPVVKLNSPIWALRSVSNTQLLSPLLRRGVHGKASLSLDRPARTRFAPSPTGYLHLGSLRTALFNYLLAKRTGGHFLLRIEDTDQKRLVKDAEQRICDDLTGAGLSWDEGPTNGGAHAPYRQSERTSLYSKRAATLLESGAAFRCFCSADQLTAQHEASKSLHDAQVASSKLSGCQSDCSSLSPANSRVNSLEKPFVVRLSPGFKVPSWTDLIYGKIEINPRAPLHDRLLSDVVLLKTDGTPTYHLANVVDDHAMQITHVIRGTEWMSSTALHVALYNAFGWQMPSFAHVGLLTDDAGNKLSKRNLDTDFASLRDTTGILPEALINFLALLGWQNPGRTDVMSLQEMSKTFDLKCTRGNTIVSLDKLWYLQKHHAKARIQDAYQNPAKFDELASMICSELTRRTFTPAAMLKHRALATHVQMILLADSESFENAAQYVQRNLFFFEDDDSANVLPFTEIPADTDMQLHDIAIALLEDPDVRHALNLWPRLDSPPAIDVLAHELHKAASTINSAIVSLSREQVTQSADTNHLSPAEVKKLCKERAKAVHGHFRRYLTFGKSCPSTGHVMAILGHDECLQRLGRL